MDSFQDRFESVVKAKDRLRASTSSVASFTRGSRFRQVADAESMAPDTIAALPEPLRLAMALLAKQAAGPDEALGPIIGLLVDGDADKQASIVNAFRTNEPLREQWLRTYEILRG